MPLEINQIPSVPRLTTPLEEMVEGDFVKCRTAGKGADVPPCPLFFLFARTTIAIAFQRMILLIRRSISRFPGYAG